MGRSRGSLTTKIHAVVDADGRPIRLALTAGQAYDGRMAEPLLKTISNGAILLGDKAYDTNAIRAFAKQRQACAEAVVHQAAPTRGAIVVETLMGGHRPQVWCSDRFSAQQGHGVAHQTCLAHLARDVAYAEKASEDALPWRLRLWLKQAFALGNDIASLAASTIAAKRRSLEKSLNDILAPSTHCDFSRKVQNKFRRARDQLLTFALYSGMVQPTNNACERALRPAVIQRKVTNGYRAMWAAKGEADVRTVVDTARLRPGAGTFRTILQTVTA